ncbi:hypothetical protein BGZ49_009774 [Haplosporangium sp. Z 27]|nr:hypothetical protein BGZ49_009774 [Haplosporangium sp. Z 27]
MVSKSSAARKRTLASSKSQETNSNNSNNNNKVRIPKEQQILLSSSSKLVLPPISTTTDDGSASMSETSDTSPVSASSATSSTSTSSLSAATVVAADKALPKTFITNNDITFTDNIDGAECVNLDKQALMHKRSNCENKQAHVDKQTLRKDKKKKRVSGKDETNINFDESKPTLESLTNEEQFSSSSIFPPIPTPIETRGNDEENRDKADENALYETDKLILTNQPNKDARDVHNNISENHNNNNSNSTVDMSTTSLKSEKVSGVAKSLTDKTIDPDSNDANRENPSLHIVEHASQKVNKSYLDTEMTMGIDQQSMLFPGMEPRNRQQNRQQKTAGLNIMITESEMSRLGKDELFQEYESIASVGHMTELREWEEASEKVVRDTIKCLIKENDMQLSYISILSAINVLNSRYGQESEISSAVPIHIMKVHQKLRKEAKEKTGKLYSKLLKIMTRSSISNVLSLETTRQGTVTPEVLYLKLYDAIQQAGYSLQDQDHLQMCQFLLEHQRTEDALVCLNKIDPRSWNSAVYRASITCHLFSKPRHLHEAEIVLDKYLEHIKTPLLDLLNSNKPNSNLTLEKSYREKERFNISIIKRWFKLQQDASKWEEIKAQYERRRAKLLDTPENIGWFSNVATLDYEQKSASDMSTFKQLDNKRGSTALSISTTSSAFSIPQVETSTINTTATMTIEKPHSSLLETTTSPASISNFISPFSFLTSFMSRGSISSNGSKSSAKDTINSSPTIKTSPTQIQPPNLSNQPNTFSNNYQINRYLTNLDNGMLEECIEHKRFKYGWEQVYERMGPALEDKETAKIAMRLCKRAFLGHGGLGSNQPGSPNILAKDICFEDEYQNLHHYDDDDEDDESKEWRRIEATLKERAPEKNLVTPSDEKPTLEDPEIWEARAWVVYNKAMTSPLLFGSNGGSPTKSPIQLQQPPSSANRAFSRYQHRNSVNLPSITSLSSIPPPSTTVVTGTSSLTVFLHNILTVAINSPEKSSRFLKAFRIYSAMRNDTMQQYQVQLRDPFVMTCMIKAIYDTVLTILRTRQQQQQHQIGKQESQEYAPSRSIDLPELEPSGTPSKPPSITIGPLIDLAFEIYADMRNVGPIRDLPQLSALAPMSPTIATPGVSTINPSISNSMSIFFQLSNRSQIPSSATVDLSACGTSALLAETAPKLTPPTSIATRASADSTTTTQCILQELNPNLVPNIHARRLPGEIYLALLHLCIQVPLSGIQQSFRVVKTITTDMMSIKSGQQPADLDRHLAAALQFYHDQWMCRPVELKERSNSNSNNDNDNSKSKYHQQGVNNMTEGCIFHEWMSRPDDYILKHMKVLNSHMNTTLVSDLSDTSTMITTDSSAFVKAPSSRNKPLTTDSSVNTQYDEDRGVEPTWEENSQYSISKLDADLDELDQYLRAKAAATGMNHFGADDHQGPGNSSVDAGTNWTDGLDHDTCNDRFYWDLWSREDPVLQNVRFSRRRARMLWRHVADLNYM